jgi:hypothetical protein
MYYTTKAASLATPIARVLRVTFSNTILVATETSTTITLSIDAADTEQLNRFLASVVKRESTNLFTITNITRIA